MKAHFGFLQAKAIATLAACVACAPLLGLASPAPLGPGPNRNLETFNTIRIGRLPLNTFYLALDPNYQRVLVDSALKRYKDAGYNYVLMYTSILDTTNPLMDTDAEVEASLRFVVRKAAAHGLRVIPQINIGAAHSIEWERMSGRIQMNRNLCNRCDNGRAGVDASPSYAADPQGIDTSFARILTLIRRAFADSVVRYPLEYVHLTYDEFANNYSDSMRYGNLLPSSGAVWKYKDLRMSQPFSLPGGASPLRTLSRAKVDSAFIANSGAATRSAAVQELVVNSLYRRLLQARQYLDPEIKMMIYADVFDAEYIGRLTFKTQNLDTVRFSGTLATLPGLSAPQAALLRQNLILMPWFYGGSPYNPGKTYAQFTNSGFKTIYGVAIQAGLYWDSWWMSEGLAAMNVYMDSSRSFQGSVLGYAAQWWRANESDSGQGDISRQTAEAAKAKALFPRASIRYDQTAPTTLLLFQ